jgi:hypothetical protein
MVAVAGYYRINQSHSEDIIIRPKWDLSEL